MNSTGAATRAAGLARLESFVESAGSRYASTRNFDFGPDRRGNVSLLSAYVRHRLVLEREILDLTLGRHSMSAAGKFVEEVFWRAYFKGWLEHRPSVWQDYRAAVEQELTNLDLDSALLQRYEAAITGATGIDCFDAWVGELVRTGYLHNHARMWFASIWVFTLALPWQLGADFFLRHLIDGDPASNTLSWRWVCGLQTKGKTYLARVSNIASYTDNRFDPHGLLAISAPPLTEPRVHPLRDLPTVAALPGQGRIGLLLTEEDCFAENLLADLSPCALFGLIATERRSPLPVGSAAAEFAAGAVADALDRAGSYFGLDGHVVGGDDLGEYLTDLATAQELDAVVTPYAPVGPVAETLAAIAPKLERWGVRLLEIRRQYDELTWPHAKRGYFKLKGKIPLLLRAMGIGGPDPDAQREAG